VRALVRSPISMENTDNLLSVLEIIIFKKIKIDPQNIKMVRYLAIIIISLGICSALLMEHAGVEDTVLAHNKAVVCYWGTWSNYRPGSGKFTPSDVDPSLCTHLVYSFAGVDKVSMLEYIYFLIAYALGPVPIVIFMPLNNAVE
jgi:hypothetical protein